MTQELQVHNFRFLILLALCTAVSGCKFIMVVPVGGGVVSDSGTYSCGAEQVCEVDVSLANFDEVFTAIPTAGYRFEGWKRQDYWLCGGQTGSCDVSNTFIAGTTLVSLISDDTLKFHLEPVFVADSEAVWSGDYQIDTDRLALSCNDGQRGAGEPVHVLYNIVQQGDQIIFNSYYDQILAPGATVIRQDLFAGTVMADGSFVAQSNALLFSDLFHADMEMRLQFEGRFSGAGLSGQYIVDWSVPSIGLSCRIAATAIGRIDRERRYTEARGIWRGTVALQGGSAIPAIGLVSEFGEVRIAVADGQHAIGTMTTNGNQFKASTLSFAPIGYYFTQNDLTFFPGSAEGSFNHRRAINGINYSEGEEVAHFNFSYDGSFDRPSGLSVVAGTYDYLAPDGYRQVYIVDAEGNISATSTDSCRATGRIAPINPDKNMYRVAVNFSSCNYINGEHRGLASLSDDGGRSNSSLIVSVSGAKYVVRGMLTRR